jgi:hypothetical protein
MHSKKELAIELRRKGKSYKEICDFLKVPKSTLSGWLSDLPWSLEIKKDLSQKARLITVRKLKGYNKRRSIYWLKWREDAREEARIEFANLVKDPLFISGIMLYWGEGDSKPKNPVRIANTDPRMISLYSKFLKESLKIPLSELRVSNVTYEDLNTERCKEFWSKISGIPLAQFHKTQIIKGCHPTKRLEHGICSLIVSSRRVKEKFLTWIDLLSKTL